MPLPLTALLESARPRQWVKNVFVLAPLVFAKRAGDPVALAAALWAAILFCMASSAVYLFNDLRDAEQDRRHPDKRRRPIASGHLGVRAAARAAVVLGLAAVAGALPLGWPVAAVLAAYLALNLAYTVRAKHVAYVDVGFIATGFLLRVVGGGLAIPVEVSRWILLCTLALSVYLGLGKRLHELAVVPDGGGRLVLRRYSVRVARLLFRLAGLVVLSAYAAYTMSPRAVENFGSASLVWTTPLVLLGLLRFDAMVRAQAPRSPTDALVSDVPFLAVAAAWCLAVVLLVYL